jgi:pyridoxal phosphate enzyme (YggS family)
MSVDVERYQSLLQYCEQRKVKLVAVSKTKPVEDIMTLYQLGQRDFGENYVQELVAKQPQLPSDIRWHFIGHLQSNKVKYIAPFVYLVHGVDSLKLLKEIDKQAQKNNRTIGCLLQMHIAKEETKFGLNEKELKDILFSADLSTLQHIRVNGLMGMASFSDNTALVRSEFEMLLHVFKQYQSHTTPNCRFETLSMGMSGDFEMAVDCGSNMVRIGSLLFGQRQ